MVTPIFLSTLMPESFSVELMDPANRAMEPGTQARRRTKSRNYKATASYLLVGNEYFDWREYLDEGGDTEWFQMLQPSSRGKVLRPVRVIEASGSPLGGEAWRLELQVEIRHVGPFPDPLGCELVAPVDPEEPDPPTYSDDLVFRDQFAADGSTIDGIYPPESAYPYLGPYVAVPNSETGHGYMDSVQVPIPGTPIVRTITRLKMVGPSDVVTYFSENGFAVAPFGWTFNGRIYKVEGLTPRFRIDLMNDVTIEIQIGGTLDVTASGAYRTIPVVDRGNYGYAIQVNRYADKLALAYSILDYPDPAGGGMQQIFEGLPQVDGFTLAGYRLQAGPGNSGIYLALAEMYHTVEIINNG